MICPNCQQEIKTNGKTKYYACKCGVTSVKNGDELTIFKTRPVWGSLVPEVSPPDQPKK